MSEQKIKRSLPHSPRNVHKNAYSVPKFALHQGEGEIMKTNKPINIIKIFQTIFKERDETEEAALKKRKEVKEAVLKKRKETKETASRKKKEAASKKNEEREEKKKEEREEENAETSQSANTYRINSITSNLVERIECIECSIKKLELDMRLANEDSIEEDDFKILLDEIKALCDDATCIKSITTEEFERSVRMKRKMNGFSAMIKMASFICPILAIANKSLITKVAEQNVTEVNIEHAKRICSYIITSFSGLSLGSLENEELIETSSTVVDFIDKAQDIGVLEAVITFIDGTNIKKPLIDAIKRVCAASANTTVNSFLTIATKPQRIIAIASLILLSMNILLNLMNGNIDTSSIVNNIHQITISGGKRTKLKKKNFVKATKPKVSKSKVAL